MRSNHTVVICTLLFSLSLLPSVLDAQGRGTVDIRILDEPLADLKAAAATVAAMPHTAPRNEIAGVATRTAGTSDVLLLPYFEVDRRSAGGISTLFAVRNESDVELDVRILYLTAVGGEVQREQVISVAPAAVRTINLRDVPGLQIDDDGVARGLVVLGALGSGDGTSETLSGDFFFIDPATGFATGNTLLHMSLGTQANELCAEWGTRFFRGGSFSGASSFRVVVDVPSGAAPYDPPTAVGTVYDESGRAVQSFEIRTDLNTFHLSSDELAPERVFSGSLSIRFPDTEGAVLVEHSGFERLSVALKAACRDGGSG